jgi:hypothetical protein
MATLFYLYNQFELDDEKKQTKRRNKIMISSSFATLWPPFLFTLVNGEDRNCLVSLVPLLWMLFLYLINVRMSYSTTISEKNPGLIFEPTTVTALSFGLAGLSGARSGSNHSRLLVYAITICIVFVLPKYDIPEDEEMTFFMKQVQAGALSYSIGLMLTGVFLSSSKRTSTPLE